MLRLKDAHRGRRALVIFGGQSVIELKVDFQALRSRDFVIFLESEALTPYFLSFGITPDYFLMLFPEKCKDNGVQNFIYRSFLAGVDIRWFLKKAHLPALEEMRDHFDEYFAPWRAQRGAHKRYRYRPGVYLKDSPYDLIGRIPTSRILANRELMADHFPGFSPPNEVYWFTQSHEEEPFDLDAYYAPAERDGELVLRNNGFLNSAAIALYPLLRYMGFRDVYFLGMDMSMLGSMEYAALYSFRSMWHFRWFFWLCRRAFNAAYRMNRPFYLRPQSEFHDIRLLWNHDGMQFTRVYTPFKYAAPLDGIRTVPLERLLRD